MCCAFIIQNVWLLLLVYCCLYTSTPFPEQSPCPMQIPKAQRLEWWLMRNRERKGAVPSILFVFVCLFFWLFYLFEASMCFCIPCVQIFSFKSWPLYWNLYYCTVLYIRATNWLFLCGCGFAQPAKEFLFSIGLHNMPFQHQYRDMRNTHVAGCVYQVRQINSDPSCYKGFTAWYKRKTCRVFIFHNLISKRNLSDKTSFTLTLRFVGYTELLMNNMPALHAQQASFMRQCFLVSGGWKWQIYPRHHIRLYHLWRSVRRRNNLVDVCFPISVCWGIAVLAELLLWGIMVKPGENFWAVFLFVFVNWIGTGLWGKQDGQFTS